MINIAMMAVTVLLFWGMWRGYIVPGQTMKQTTINAMGFVLGLLLGCVMLWGG